jgi:two-component system chemotaxis response regulator CheY
MSTKILIVDDSDTIRQELVEVLSSEGYTVISAVDGQDGIDKANENQFDLIITDYNMPKKTGLDLVKELKINDNYKNINILMLTTEVGSDLKKQAKEAGLRAWIVKPFQKDNLLKVIQKLT